MSALSVISQNLTLVAALGLGFFWAKSETLSLYSLQLIALGIIVFSLIPFLAKKIPVVKRVKLVTEFTIVTLIVSLLIFSTGGFGSPVFFLLYFLLFGVATLGEPSASLALATTFSLLFLVNPSADLANELLQLSSLFVITPLALIFGSQYKKAHQDEAKIDYLKNEENLLTKEIVSQETAVKNWTSQELKENLAKIWENLEAVSQDYSVSPNAKQKFMEISNQLKNLLKSAEEMEKKVEK